MGAYAHVLTELLPQVPFIHAVTVAKAPCVALPPLLSSGSALAAINPGVSSNPSSANCSVLADQGVQCDEAGNVVAL